MNFSAFVMGRRGNMVVDRDALHASVGYKRQIEALSELRKRRVTDHDPIPEFPPRQGREL